MPLWQVIALFLAAALLIGFKLYCVFASRNKLPDTDPEQDEQTFSM